MIIPEFDTSQGLALITDGSASTKDKSGGWAFIIIDAFDHFYKESGYRPDTTINQMELMGPTKGLEVIYTFCGPSEILVYSDSEYVVLGMTDRSRKRNKNKPNWAWLEKAADKHPYVEFIHIKGHNDNLWNEMADQLAGEARREGIAVQSNS